MYISRLYHLLGRLASVGGDENLQCGFVSHTTHTNPFFGGLAYRLEDEAMEVEHCCV